MAGVTLLQSSDNFCSSHCFIISFHYICFTFQFERGVYALMGTVDPESFDTLNSYAKAFEMPFVTPWFPESVHQVEMK